jgi:hypothetical protein
MNWLETTLEISIITILLGILQFLFSNWIKLRLENSIKHEYDKFIEDYRYDIKVKEQASKIAEYLSIIEGKRLDPSGDFDFKRANKLAWELLIWLPEDLYLELKEALDPKKQSEDKNSFKVLLKIREYLKKEKTKITDNDVFFHFSDKKEHIAPRKI